MARSSRQNKILELISLNEIETQDDLVSRLRANKFNVTQATISRDIKELGIIKILSSETGKYKYSFPEATSQTSSKYIYLVKDSIISMKTVKNLVVLKTIKDMASGVCGAIDKFNLENILGSVYGIDTVMLIFNDNINAEYTLKKLDGMLNN